MSLNLTHRHLKTNPKVVKIDNDPDIPVGAFYL